MTTSNLRVVSSGPDGALEINDAEVIITKLSISNPDLAAYLVKFDSPQEQLVAMVDLINLAVSVKKLAGSTLETENVRQSAEKVVQELTGTVATVMQKIDSSTRLLVDPETGIVALKLREAADNLTSEQKEALKKALSPSDAASPIGQLQATIQTALNTHVEGIKTDISNLKGVVDGFIGSQEKKKELYVKSREKGGDFEEILDEIIQLEAAVHGDDARFMGDTQSQYGKNVGDEVITINHLSKSHHALNIVWEAKTDMTFKDKKGRMKRDKVAEELNAAIYNRDAVYGIFVSDVNGLDLTVQPLWQEFDGNKLVIVIDPEDPDHRLIRTAYLWARANALRSVSTNDDQLDLDAVKRIIEDIARECSSLSTLKRHHTAIKTGYEDAVAFVTNLQGNLDKQIKDLQSLLVKGQEA